MSNARPRVLPQHPPMGIETVQRGLAVADYPCYLSQVTNRSFVVMSCAPGDRPAGVPGLPVFVVLREFFFPTMITVPYLSIVAGKVERLLHDRIRDEPNLQCWYYRTALLLRTYYRPKVISNAAVFPLVQIDPLFGADLNPIPGAQFGAPILLLILQAPEAGIRFWSPGYSSSGIILNTGDAVLLGPHQDEHLGRSREGLIARYYVPMVEGFEPAPLRVNIQKPSVRSAAPRAGPTYQPPARGFGIIRGWREDAA